MPQQYRVKQGDCISSIAAQFGHVFDTIWNHGDNADLKERRKDPNVLYPGDVVVIPDKEQRLEDRGTDSHHKFTTNAAPTHIKIRLLLDDQPRSGVDYELQVGGVTITGTTDGDGCLNEEIPPLATDGTLVLTEGQSREVIPLALGSLDPIDTEDGVRKRLEALGFEIEDLDAACRSFRSKESMDADGGIDDAFRDKLKEKFGQ